MPMAVDIQKKKGSWHCGGAISISALEVPDLCDSIVYRAVLGGYCWFYVSESFIHHGRNGRVLHNSHCSRSHEFVYRVFFFFCCCRDICAGERDFAIYLRFYHRFYGNTF